MANPGFSLDKPPANARELVYQTLRDDIVGMRLAPGLMLTEKGVSETLEVSRTPVREAFIKLAQEELVTVRPQRGTYVSPIVVSRIAEARLVRRAMEREIMPRLLAGMDDTARNAIRYNLSKQEYHLSLFGQPQAAMAFFGLDNELHRLLFGSVGMARVWDMIHQFSSHLNRVRILYLLAKEEWESLVEQHRDIVGAIEAKDATAALAMLDRHLSRTDADLIRLRETYPDYFE